MEQITISYVVIRQGDLRRLVLPISYFLEKPFRNWTKLSSEVVGSIKLVPGFSHSASTTPKSTRQRFTAGATLER